MAIVNEVTDIDITITVHCTGADSSDASLLQADCIFLLIPA